LNDENEIIDFGAVEVQAVYITGNVKKAFKKYMESPITNYGLEWPRKNYPKPDYLSSSRKRLAPQLIYKGGILYEWGKKMVVVAHRGFYDQLPPLKEVTKSAAEIAWMIYDFRHDSINNRYILERQDIKYTKFKSALRTITTPIVGDMEDFLGYLRGRIKEGKIMGAPPSAEIPPEIEPLPELFAEDNEEIATDE
jgi:hypothetical protein